MSLVFPVKTKTKTAKSRRKGKTMIDREMRVVFTN